jgi:hypothetical protein
MAEMRWHGSSMMKSVSRETDEASSIIDDERKKAPQSISLRDTLVEQLSTALIGRGNMIVDE